MPPMMMIHATHVKAGKLKPARRFFRPRLSFRLSSSSNISNFYFWSACFRHAKLSRHCRFRNGQFRLQSTPCESVRSNSNPICFSRRWRATPTCPSASSCAKSAASGLCTTDLVNARSLLEKNPKAFKLIETRPADSPLAVQLFGSVPGRNARRRARSRIAWRRIPLTSTWAVPFEKSARSAAARP